MSIKKVFVDSDQNELQCYVNTQGKLFIEASSDKDDIYYKGYVALEKEDVDELIKELRQCREDMDLYDNLKSQEVAK